MTNMVLSVSVCSSTYPREIFCTNGQDTAGSHPCHVINGPTDAKQIGRAQVSLVREGAGEGAGEGRGGEEEEGVPGVIGERG